MNEYFGRIPVAMSTLFYAGTLGDSIWQIWQDIWQLGKEGDPKGYIFLGVFFLYVFLSMFTILNMLIGVLCEVVTAVSQESKEETLIHYVQSTLLTVIEEIDESGNGMVSREEFVKLIKDPRAIKAFEDLNVDIDNFEKMTGMLFDPDTPGGPDKEMHPGMFLKRVLEMRGNNHARVFDIIELSNQLLRVESKLAEKLEKRVEAPQGSEKERVENRLDNIERAVQSLAAQVGELTKKL